MRRYTLEEFFSDPEFEELITNSERKYYDKNGAYGVHKKPIKRVLLSRSNRVLLSQFSRSSLSQFLVS